ncbi:heat shock 70 kDa protein 15-like [Lactuca sativa]|uniref:heat shock 70 kDa protein 15-like n=1 Tax=Lactuca sativa TaxID=4236 RepID=UPI0022B06C94|nr:heat shock 70 kDa protein 15-like [Lactuca sativa]
MSVVGFDLGNESCVVAVARQRGIDVVLNDESKHETPALVCFGDKQRFLGTAGAATSMMNPKNTISQIKRLIGCPFSDPELQQDLKALPFSVTEGPDGFPLINARYLGETKSFTPTQVMGMVFSNMKTIAEKNLNAAVVDCCIWVPIYFTDLQRRAIMDAATIAGLHPLWLMHETIATALAYGIYKTDLPENEQLNVAFIDIGHASMQVCSEAQCPLVQYITRELLTCLIMEHVMRFASPKYAPVRSDSVVGELKLSEPTDVILLEITRIEMLAVTGTFVQKRTNPLSHYNHNVLAHISCDLITLVSWIFFSGIPKIEKLEIEEKAFHTNLYAVRCNYSGGKEGEIERIIKHMINLFGLVLSVAPSPAPVVFGNGTVDVVVVVDIVVVPQSTKSKP